MDQSTVLKYEWFHCCLTGGRCWVTVEAKHVSMGGTGSLKSGETEKTDSCSAFVSQTIKKVADG